MAADSAPRAARLSVWPWSLALGAFVAMFAPTYWQAATGLWQTDEFGHGPIVLAVVAWLLGQRRRAIVDAARRTGARTPAATTAGLAFFALGAVAYLLGRVFAISSAEFVGHWLVAGSVLLVMGGTGTLRVAAFAWLYLLFMVPLPATLVDLITGPLKQVISGIVVDVLHVTGYPIARAGVQITVGPYELLVADACSGLNSMFSLAALGTLFIHVVSGSRSFAHVTLLVALIVPIAFVANIVRVGALVLVTYHFGDAAGQGFLHGAAGIVLVVMALAIFAGADSVLARVLPRDGRRPT